MLNTVIVIVAAVLFASGCLRWWVLRRCCGASSAPRVWIGGRPVPGVRTVRIVHGTSAEHVQTVRRPPPDRNGRTWPAAGFVCRHCGAALSRVRAGQVLFYACCGCRGAGCGCSESERSAGHGRSIPPRVMIVHADPREHAGEASQRI